VFFAVYLRLGACAKIIGVRTYGIRYKVYLGPNLYLLWVNTTENHNFGANIKEISHIKQKSFSKRLLSETATHRRTDITSTYGLFILYKERLKSIYVKWTPLAWTSSNFHKNPSEVITGDRLKDTRPVWHYKPPITRKIKECSEILLTTEGLIREIYFTEA
jgi:hypothetical protein